MNFYFYFFWGGNKRQKTNEQTKHRSLFSFFVSTKDKKKNQHQKKKRKKTRRESFIKTIAKTTTTTTTKKKKKKKKKFFCRPHRVVVGGGVGDAFRGRGRGRERRRRLHEYQQKTTATIKKKEENDQRKRGCRRRNACVLAVVAAFATAANEKDGGAGRARAASRDAIRIGGGKKGGGEKVVSDFSNLKILLSEIKRTDTELSQMIGLLKRASEVGTDVPFDSMSFVFENRDSAIYNFQNNALKLDAFVDAEELTPIEAAVWDSIPQKNGGGVHTPFIVTPNEFVCALYSCVNSPDAPPSTEAALTIDMLRKGVAMGKRKDKRITADGLLLTAEDARGKVQRYVEILESSSIFSKSSK